MSCICCWSWYTMYLSSAHEMVIALGYFQNDLLFSLLVLLYNLHVLFFFNSFSISFACCIASYCMQQFTLPAPVKWYFHCSAYKNLLVFIRSFMPSLPYMPVLVWFTFCPVSCNKASLLIFLSTLFCILYYALFCCASMYITSLMKTLLYRGISETE